MTLRSPVRIVVADDFAQWRVRIRYMLEAHPEWQVVGEAAHGLQAIQGVTDLCPDIVLLDIGMPILNGLEAAKEIRKTCPSTRIIFMTQESDPEIRAAALATGAEGYLVKANAGTELLQMVETALAGSSRRPRATLQLGRIVTKRKFR
jgi:DNA-binding NarL/FixJ family response regulator